MQQQQHQHQQPVLPSLTNLTSLHLGNVVYGLSGGLAALSSLKQLQQLECYDLYPLLPLPARAQNRFVIQQHELWQSEIEKLQHDMLLCLSAWTQLTSVEMDPGLLPVDAVGPFSRLQQLQRLELPKDDAFDSEGVQSAAVLAGLSSSLTKLQLIWTASDEFSSSTCSAIAGLAEMQHLKVAATVSQSGRVLVSCCSSMQQLREL
jgi:hypothetical protein